ncbi:MAG: hypothetical protein DRN24_04785 [Thermoplasmata archaeon]|nr:MAG: hypothetical protein DRN24_04785 [Thermoplasmata archaeon]
MFEVIHSNMLNYNVEIFDKKFLNKKFPFYIMGLDVGGTNTNIAIAGVNSTKNIEIFFSIDFKTQELDSLTTAVNETLYYASTQHNIVVKHACIGAAGVVSPSNDYVDLTHVKWNISSEELTKETPLEKVFIINDFQAIGYGVNLLDLEKDVFKIRTNRGMKNSKETKAVIGAGTGLGKCILFHNKEHNMFIPIASEGGHSDFPVQNNYEMMLIDFIKKTRRISTPINYEELVSGRGIENIYLFLRDKKEYPSNRYTKEIDQSMDKTPLISKYKNVDETCKKVFKLFTRFYGRCAKNFILETMATGGLYIAGGIAVKNKEIFSSKEFFEELENSYQRTNVLKNIPVYVILNYKISLYGACLAGAHRFLK